MHGAEAKEDKTSLSSPNYDPLIHLNQVLPEPSSLSSLPTIQLHLTAHLRHLDTEIQTSSVKQREQQSVAQERITSLQTELEDLFRNVEEVKMKAEKADGVMGGL